MERKLVFEQSVFTFVTSQKNNIERNHAYDVAIYLSCLVWLHAILWNLVWLAEFPVSLVKMELYVNTWIMLKLHRQRFCICNLIGGIRWSSVRLCGWTWVNLLPCSSLLETWWFNKGKRHTHLEKTLDCLQILALNTFAHSVTKHCNTILWILEITFMNCTCIILHVWCMAVWFTCQGINFVSTPIIPISSVHMYVYLCQCISLAHMV